MTVAPTPFGGRIGRTQAESEPWWPTPAHPRPDAPDVVLVLLDDLGFAHLGCFGSDLDTPNIDRLAAGGVRFSNFHVTPLCSPTRAALLTGRNHHTVGMRGISNWDSGYPHMRGKISPEVTTIAEVLRDVGYATFALGKWHLCPMDEASAAGPFDGWPLARGFDRYYGFLDGETDQFTPDLVHDNHHVDPPRTVEEGYHLSADLVDRAIGFLHDSISIRPDRPCFTYLAFGATHAPHQAPEEYLRRQRGRHDAGWDDARQRWFARQREMGLVPDTTELAPRNPGVASWAELSDAERRLAVRMQEAFAAFLEHTDEQIGRLIDSLDRLGRLDNTLFILLSDNGASQEGGPFGVLHEMKFFNFLIEQPEEAVARIDEIGGPRSHANYPWGWAQAGNTPFRWYKQNTHAGGVHVPCIVHWPAGVSERGVIRSQFHHVVDIAATVFDAVGVEAPEVFRGIPQIPVAGESMRSSLLGATPGPSPRVQYFEMLGHRAVIAEGWKAVTRHQPGTSFDDDVWELYHLDVDASECEDLARSRPDKLAALVDLWWSEAERHGVLPLDDRGVELFGARFRERSTHPPSRRYRYMPPMAPLPAQSAAAIGGRSWRATASILCSEGDSGVLYAVGNGNSGLSLFIQDDHLVFDYNCFGDHRVVESSSPVPLGSSTVGVRFERLDDGGRITLEIDGDDVGGDTVPFVMRVISSVGASVGHDHGSAVSERYDAPFAFSGELHEVIIELGARNSGEERGAAQAEGRAEFMRQ